jgi:hypothetical protein
MIVCSGGSSPMIAIVPKNGGLLAVPSSEPRRRLANVA